MARGTHVPQLTPGSAARAEQTVLAQVLEGAGGSALTLLLLPRERPFASQVPGVASLSGIKQTLLRSGARCCPSARGTSPSLPCAPPCLLPFPHAGKSMCPWG